MTFHDDKLAPIAEHNQREKARNRPVSLITSRKKVDTRGKEFGSLARVLGLAGGNIPHAMQIAENQYPKEFETFFKAAVGAGTTTHPTYGSPLVPAYEHYAAGFVDYLRDATILGRFGTGNIPALRAVPFNIKVPTQVSGGKGYWVGQGAAKPLTKFDFGTASLGWNKVANIAVITEELLRWSDPAADLLIRDQLVAAIAETIDESFVNPASTAIEGVRPASITSGVTAIPSVGGDISAIRQDVSNIMGTFLAAKLSPKKGVWIMDSMTVLRLTMMTNVMGDLEFPDLDLDGGFFFKRPVIVSDHVDPGLIIFASAEDIMVADEGQATVDVSREASLEMSDTPIGNSTTPTPAQLVSLWATNSVGIRAERYISWEKRRPQAVAYLSGVTWGEEVFS
ncbi:phage major capsid protein, HK97 family [Devosia lucknowensis]|uniref:Phage major capsid protein, HK97 family n=1 Tax=Devosia lucknowensis TaxID=1096929 RepID=A0A1Y6EH37_9HYPH|nr:phage major capsid protein [Devosia lucknowensis]SMQ61938.1 phage major capsid protein, HK97 family [Devosia lucknowensis]